MSEKNMNWIDEIQESDLDLGGLTMPKFDWERIRKNRARRRAEQAEYKEKYGDDWFEKWWNDKNPEPDYDTDMKFINNAIYYGDIPRVTGLGDNVKEHRKMIDNRLHEIYGEQYAELVFHAPGDPRAVELLLQDALKTGKWKELPDCLQEEYHKRIQN